MNELNATIGALGGAFATIGGVVVLFIKARNQGARPTQVLRRVRDWIEGMSSPKSEVPLIDQMPPSLRADVDRILEEGDER